MDKIKKYLEFVFSDFKATSRVIELKEEIEGNLIEKMNDYIAEGMSEEEASLKAIGSLGNIEDVLKEIGVELNQVNQTNEDYLSVIDEEFKDHKRRYSRGSVLISLGVFLCIMSVSGFSISSFNESTAFILLFVSLIFAVPMFIVAGTTYFNVDHHEMTQLIKTYHNHSDFQHYISSHKQEDQRKEMIGGLLIALGVALCIMGVMVSTIIELEQIYVLLFLFVGLGVVCFIQAGMRFFSTSRRYHVKSLLGTASCQSQSTSKNNRILDAIDGIVYPLLAITYVAISLFINTEWWRIGWIVFPVYAIISSGIRAVSRATNND